MYHFIKFRRNGETNDSLLDSKKTEQAVDNQIAPKNQ